MLNFDTNTPKIQGGARYLDPWPEQFFKSKTPWRSRQRVQILTVNSSNDDLNAVKISARYLGPKVVFDIKTSQPGGSK